MNGYLQALQDSQTQMSNHPLTFKVGNIQKRTINLSRMVSFFTFLRDNADTTAYWGSDVEFLCNKQGFVMLSEPSPIDGRFVDDYRAGLQKIIDCLSEWSGRISKADIIAMIQHLREV